ncbi:glutamate--tRNA ligase family protein [Mucilaginibacter sp. UR6-1]|uniref:glutamate--tRNA ligase family protein n=1 Tax=Mucilaginibacter sp. UR6-1 TaxID=1435643 RepID=UPI001E54DF9C|nr:glutamate--tRNA ligase family protein [Mucilaginibacter sp. UR6-1]MCC8411179.1 glutamate--tRNA ligase family protein [Mucilaginibacter sp. UR6-1]
MNGFFMDAPPVYKRTRIAPTPSGYLHVGNALSFIITVGLAAETGAQILLRIDDMDRDRADKRYVQDVFDILQFLDIPWQQGPLDLQDYQEQWSQILRLDKYHDALGQLRQSGQVFACNCSRSQLKGHAAYPGTCRYKNIPLDAPDVSWRFKTERATISVKTLNGNITGYLPTEMTDFVVRKKDGYPAYQLSSVVDDVHFGVDLIVRGQDLWASTLAQLYLSQRLGLPFGEVTFHHHPLLLGSDGAKLSKSAGAASIKYLREQGLSTVQVLNTIAKQAGIKEPVSEWRQLYEKLKLRRG